jgi:hypothetical protein
MATIAANLLKGSYPPERDGLFVVRYGNDCSERVP